MDQFPRELVRHILLFLEPKDRIQCSLTCRAWAEEVCDAALMEGTWLVLRGVQTKSMMPTLLKSRRKYRNIKVIGGTQRRSADLNVDYPFLWHKFGALIKRLHFIECSLTYQELSSILRQCPQVESLKLQGFSLGCAAYEGLEPPGRTRPTKTFESFPNVHCLRIEFNVTHEILDYLLRLLPNAVALSIVEASEEYYELPELASCILNANRMFTKLDIIAVDLSTDDFIELMRLHSETLKDLRVSCGRLEFRAFVALGDCTKLEHLNLEAAFRFEDCHVAKLIRNSPDLKTLDVSRCERLSDTGFARIKSLEKLVELNLHCCPRLTVEALNDFGRIGTTLRVLDLQGAPYGTRLVPKVARLKSLTALVVDCVMSTEEFNMICDNLKMLERIHLGSCENLTDAEGVRFAEFKHLKSLGFHGGNAFTEVTFETGLLFPEFDSLRIGASLLTDESLASMAMHQNRLMVLELMGCKLVTDDGLAAILRRQKRLQILMLKGCDGLSDKCLSFVADLCPALETLELTECPINRREVRRFYARRPFVHVQYTPVRHYASQDCYL